MSFDRNVLSRVIADSDRSPFAHMNPQCRVFVESSIVSFGTNWNVINQYKQMAEDVEWTDGYDRFMKADPKRKQGYINKCEGDIHMPQYELGQLESKWQRLYGKRQGLEGERRALEIQVAQVSQEVSDNGNEMFQLQNEISDLKAKLQTHNSYLNTMKGTLADLIGKNICDLSSKPPAEIRDRINVHSMDQIVRLKFPALFSMYKSLAIQMTFHVNSPSSFSFRHNSNMKFYRSEIARMLGITPRVTRVTEENIFVADAEDEPRNPIRPAIRGRG